MKVKYLLLGLALGAAVAVLKPAISGIDDANPREVGVEWVNQYNGKAPNLAACNADAEGFYNALRGIGWTGNYDWGNNNAWETDFKSVAMGGNDAGYADNVDFAYFSGHGNLDGFYLGTDHTDWQVRYSDLQLGDKDLDWIAISSCLTMNWNGGAIWGRWGWPVFKGLHMICGMDTVEADTPSIGTYFVRFMTGSSAYPSYGTRLPVGMAWRYAGYYALPSTQYVAMLWAQAGTNNAWNDYLPGYGPVIPDPYPPSTLWWTRYPC